MDNFPNSGFRPRTQRGDDGIEEAALIAAVAEARVDAFETLYRRYHPRLLRFITRMTRRAGMADEVLDDTMMVVWRKAGSFQPGTRLSTWIFAIAYRQSLRALSRMDEAVELEGEPAAPGQHGPEAEHQRDELRSRLDRALQELPAEQRAAIELTYFWGHSCAETAQVMHCPVDTVKTRMFYARRKLRDLLGPAWREAI